MNANKSKRSEKQKRKQKKDLITDGYAYYSAYCGKCGRKTMEVVRFGKIQCRYCG